MRQIIKSQIQNINDALEWVKKNRPNDYAQKFLQLVEYRKVLKQIAAAEEDNPGIAAFGKSQVGKSYLISCLLQDNDGNPYMVEAEDIISFTILILQVQRVVLQSLREW